MSTDWRDWNASAHEPLELVAPGFPPPRHPAEPDIFARHLGVGGHDQTALSAGRVLVVGAGGLGSWAALGLARSGIGSLVIVDGDRFDRTNASRQLMYGGDLGEFKAEALARNLVPHMTMAGTIVGVTSFFDQNFDHERWGPFQLALFLVDNNQCRWAGARFARGQRVPAVFAMLSPDGGMRMHHFLQGPGATDPCLWCALPNLVVDAALPCAAGVSSTCLMSSGMTVYFAHRALMGWPTGVPPYNWREDDLTGRGHSAYGLIERRTSCALCG
jgi:hypothetical protein